MAAEDILPLVGTAAGMATGIPGMGAVGSAAGKMFASGIKEKRAKSNLPPPVDPMQMGFLNEINDLRKSFETGSAYANQMNQLRNIQAATQSGIIKAAGGNTGAAISGMARAGRQTQDAYGAIAEAGTKNQMDLLALAGDKTDAIAQRKAELGLMQYGQGMKDSSELFNAGMGEFGKAMSAPTTDEEGNTTAAGALYEVFSKRKKKGAGLNNPATSPEE